MNILFLFHYPIIAKNGGVERVTSLLNDELSSRGHCITFLCTRRNQNFGENHIDNQLFVDWPADRESAVIDYLEILNQKKIDVIINQVLSAETYELIRVTPPNIKRISVVHVQPLSELYKEREIYLASTSKNCKQFLKKIICIAFPALYRHIFLKNESNRYHQFSSVSDYIVVLSKHFINRILDNVNDIYSHKLVAINNPNTFKSKEISLIEEKEKEILYIGRIENFPKNVIGFIKMWRILNKLQPEWKATIVGDGPDKKKCEEYVIKHNIKNITFEGKQSDVESFYKRSAFVCLTSFFEGWGMVLTEGMAYGCIPVCFASYESCYDIIDDGKDGIIVPAFNYKEMARRISSVIDSPNEMKKMSKISQEKISNFNLSTVADEWEKLLNA